MELSHDDRAPVQPSRVRTARELRGWTQLETVRRMPHPITAAALSQIEAGRVRPTDATLRDLATALDVPLGFFGAHWPRDPTRDALARAYFRDLRRTPARERRRAGALAVLVHDLVAALELHVRLPELDLPELPVTPDATRDEIEEAATALRDAWDLGDGPIPNVVAELERHGVPVARLTLGHRQVDAFAVRFPHRPVVLLMQDKNNYVRARFDAAHELGHLVLHEAIDPTERIVEQQAHHFASSLLLPAAAAEAQLPSTLDGDGWRTLAEIKSRWGISMSAQLIRARDLTLISPDAYRNAMRFMSARGWRTNEPGDRHMGLPETPTLLERAIRTLEHDKSITLEDLITSAALPIDLTLEIVHAARDARPAVSI